MQSPRSNNSPAPMAVGQYIFNEWLFSKVYRVVKEDYLVIILDIFLLFLYKNIHCEYTFEVPHKKTYRRIIIKFSSLTRSLMLLAEKHADASILPTQTDSNIRLYYFGLYLLCSWESMVIWGNIGHDRPLVGLCRVNHICEKIKTTCLNSKIH